MTIQIELGADTEAQLVVGAATLGLDVQTYAASLLKEAIAEKAAASRRTLGETEEFFKAMAVNSEGIPE